MSKLVYELDAVFDDEGRAELRLPDVPPGTHRLSVRVEDEAIAPAASRQGPDQSEEPPLVITVTGEHFKWPTWEWTGYPADHVFTREDFYDEDD